MINCYYVLVNLRNLYPHLYSSLLQLLLTNKITRLENSTLQYNQNWPDFNVPHTRNATRPTKTGSGIFLPIPWTKMKHLYSPTDLQILLCLNMYQPTILYWVLSLFWPVKRELPESTKDDTRSTISFHSTIRLTHLLQFDERRITRIEMAKKQQGHSHTSPRQRTCCYGQEGLYQQNWLTS